MMQALTDWQGDTNSLITEMKRRAGVRTDTELAKLLGTSQSNVSTWRKRGVPNKVLLSFERQNWNDADAQTGREIVARAVAMRVAEHWYQRSRASGATAGRWLYYSTASMMLPMLLPAVASNLQRIEGETKRWAMDIASDLIEDESFLDQLADWLSSLSLGELPQSLPQSRA